MKRLPDSLKRGRPDIVHFALMEALSTPLFMNMMLKVYVHTINDKIIAIADNLRIPKSYFRFERLMVSLFRDNVIKSNEGTILMELSDGTFADLVNIIKPNMVIGLSTVGVQSKAQKVAENASKRRPFLPCGRWLCKGSLFRKRDKISRSYIFYQQYCA